MMRNTSDYNGNGTKALLRGAVLVLLSAFVAEATYTLHQVMQLREKVAAVEAKVDLILNKEFSHK